MECSILLQGHVTAFFEKWKWTRMMETEAVNGVEVLTAEGKQTGRESWPVEPHHSPQNLSLI
jgi:hypothetical protein